MSASSRLKKELIRIKKERVAGILVTSDVTSVSLWKAQIEGPEGSPYEGGLFEMQLKFPNEYPFKAPDVRFLTKVFHPNVYVSGEICLDILQNAWQPTYTGEKVLISIQSLLTDPNPASSANGKAGNMYEKSRKAYDKEARAMTKKHAMGEESQKRKRQAEAEFDTPHKSELTEPTPKRTKSAPSVPVKEAKPTKKEKVSEPKAVPPPIQPPSTEKTTEEKLIEELQAEGFKNVSLIRQLLPIVSGDKALLKSLYEGQNS